MGHELLILGLAVFLMGFACFLGHKASPRRYWWAPFIATFAAVLMIGFARRAPRWEYLQPFRILMDGRREYLILGFCAGFSMFVLIGRLKIRRQKILVGGITIAFALYSGVLPFAAPFLDRPRLSKLQTRIDENGVCRQHTDFTCGPAASVTALRQFGILADEGSLAIDMHTSTMTGTDPDVLADVLIKKYAKEGLHCHADYFQSLDDLPKNTITLAIVRYSFLVNHYVVILKIDGDEMTIADPLEGLVFTKRGIFEKRWMNLAVVMRK